MRMKWLAYGIAVLVMTKSAMAEQQEWQRLSMPTVSDVATKWINPPSVYGPEPYYGLGGPVTLETVQRDLDTLHKLGFRAVTVQAGRGMPFAYLSPEYFAFMKQFVAEAKSRDMRVWIVDDAGYPSGFAGGKFTSEAPDLRMQALVAEKIELPPHGAYAQPVKPETVGALAVNSEGASIPVAVKEGKVSFTAPEGKWTLILVTHQFRTSPTRSDTNPKNVKDGSQSLEDYLNPAATKRYLEFTHEQYKKHLGDEFGRTILGFRGDEPDYSIGGLPWTNDFFATFKKIKGYDVQPYVAAFALMPSSHDKLPLEVKLTDEQRKAKADYYDVFSQMFARGFFQPQSEWCAANGLQYQVHLNHEEMQMQLVRSEGEFFRAFRTVQSPGVDAIWHQIWKDTISDFPRLASSVSHLYGRPQAFTESFAAYRPEPSIDMARYILNEQFARGINLVEMMYFPSTATGPHAPHSYMGEPGFPALATYVRRTSYLLSMGRPDASVALYLPSSSLWYGDAASDTAFVSTERLLSEHQIDFDVVSEDALAKDLRADKGVFVTGSGSSYRTVVLPSPAVLSEEVLVRLKNFAAAGGRVVFLSRTPELIVGRSFMDARKATASDFSWATVLKGELSETPTPPAYPPTNTPEKQVIPADMLEGITKACAEELQIDSPDTALRVMKRKWKDASVYFFFNEGDKATSHTVTLRAGTKAEFWDADEGKQIPLSAKTRKGALLVELPLQPYEARVIIVQQ